MNEEQKNIKLILAYDGGRYCGWQRQKNGTSIQGVLEEKIRMMLGESVKLIASGRTDAGVHAVRQVCNFLTTSRIDPASIRRGLNSLLPDDIHLWEAAYVPLDFHARYGARRKTYEYRILNREEPDIFLRDYVWHIRMPLDLKVMGECLALLTGTHDFSAFRSTGSGNLNPVRSVSRSELKGSNDGLLRILLEADGFLRHMVRNITGTVVSAGMGRMDAGRFEEIIESRDRSLAGIKAPPQGLFLMEVLY
jgi:tRNA pseudouridine38-40 synthase